MKDLNILIEEKIEDCYHQCTSDCQKTVDCPCVQDHYCKNSPDYKAQKAKQFLRDKE